MTRHNLALAKPTPVIPVPRGPLMDAQAVASELFNGTVSDTWVRKNVPGRLRLSHRTIRWYRDDVVRWIEQRRAG